MTQTKDFDRVSDIFLVALKLFLRIYIKIMTTFGISVTNLELTCLPPWPSKTPKRVDFGQLGIKQSSTNDAK